MEAANARKIASMGALPEGELIYGTDFAERAMFSGFDIERDELVGTSIAVASMYAAAAQGMGLRPLFISAWCDGLLTGLLLASLPPEPDAGATDGTGEGG